MKSIITKVTAIGLMGVLALSLCSCTQRTYKKVAASSGIVNTSSKSTSGGTKTMKSPTATYHVKTTTKDLPKNASMMSFYANKSDKKLYQINDKNMKSFYISGVNIGLSEATTDLANPDVSYQTYKEWFKQIQAMNANTIRVFTEMPPQFYNALYDFNNNNDNPLYLIHGMWFNEDYMIDPGDCWDSKSTVVTSFKKVVTEVMDIVHGKCTNITYGTNTNARYTKDVSKWVIGYILGLEWNNDFVNNSNSHSDKTGYSGKYLKTSENATAFENFLAEVGNTLIDYETKKYNHQTPVAFLNWSTNDTLTHPNEPYDTEDSVSVNTENIVSTDKYNAGMFAAVDIYPYYPEFINYETEYANYVDPLTKKKNNYKGYLKDLINEYSVPVLVAEFGVPTSFGCSSESVLGYNQGGITEEQQGQYDSNMIVDIASSGYAGGLLFEWQDEWFKRTWNVYAYAPKKAVQRTPNKVTAEQNYGILAMEPGSSLTCAVDGNSKEWDSSDKVISNSNMTVSTKYDEGYLYINVALKNKSYTKSHIVLPISTLGVGSKKDKSSKISFSKKTDFVLDINGNKKATLKCDNYYDYYTYRNGYQDGSISLPKLYGKKSTGVYNTVKLFVTGEITLPQTKKTYKPIIQQLGNLTYGNSNPDSKSYNSLSCICGKNKTVEVRIPWYMLNVLNINEGTVMNDFEKSGKIAETKIKSISIGGGLANSSKTIKLKNIQYTKSAKSTFHTRLKKSYSYIQSTLKMLYNK